MFYIYKMDCKKLFVYGLIFLIGLYLLKDVCGIKIPFIEGMADFKNNVVLLINSRR